jgi:acyl-CoA synthetase (AMP-forming)/AMP-acid ligase II
MVTPTAPPLRSGFGHTELTGIASFSDPADPGVGISGRPSPIAQIEIVDPDGHTVPIGVTGEIIVRGPLVMNGYHRRPELNAWRSRGGWHHTNDLGRRESDGTLTFVGPASRIVKSASENIYPAEVEGCLRSHPAVREVAVIGVPDRVWSQLVLAVVVPHDGQTITLDEVVEHCRSRIASCKKPKLVKIAEALPRTGSGAVDYDALDERYGGGGYPSK